MTETAVFGSRRRMSTWTWQSLQHAACSADAAANFEMVTPLRESSESTTNTVSMAAGITEHAHQLHVLIPLAICRSRLV